MLLPNQSTKDYLLFLTTVALISMVGLMSSDIYLPAMPQMAGYFKVNQEVIQSTLSVYLLGLSLSQLIYGSLCDRFGRKSVLLCGMAIYIIASVGCMIANSIETLILCRFFQALGACSGMVISRAIVNDMYGKDGSAKIFTTIFPIVGVSPALAPLLGGFLTSYFGWRSNFGFTAIFGVVTLIMVSRCVKETLVNQISIHPLSLIKNYFSVLTNPLFLAYSLLVCAAYGAYFAYLSSSPFIFAALGYKPDATGAFYITISLLYIAGNLTGKKLIKTISVDKALQIGAAVFCLGGMLMYLATMKGITSPLQIIIPMSILVFGNGFLLPLGVAGSIGSATELAGTASGLMGFLQLGSAAICAKLVGGINLPFGLDVVVISLPMVIFITCALALGAIITVKWQKSFAKILNK